eukprot:GHVS01082735.1.p1 GENE.GHVS01082735.1~~GHVS01082735.1.p1  ORF type:complete len:543 (+),score=121.53 GHVS01082735.1:363-1991(+)
MRSLPSYTTTSYPPPCALMLSVRHHNISTAAQPPPIPPPYHHHLPLSTSSFSPLAATKKRLTSAQYYPAGLRPTDKRRLQSARTTTTTTSVVDVAGGGGGIGMQLGFSQGKVQPFANTPPHPQTTPTSCFSSTTTPTTSSPSTDSSSTTPAQQPLVSTRCHRQSSRQDQFIVGVHNKYSNQQHRHVHSLSSSVALVEQNPQPPPLSSMAMCRVPPPPPPYLPSLPLSSLPLPSSSRPQTDRTTATTPSSFTDASWRGQCHQHPSFTCECVSRQMGVGGDVGGGEFRVRASVIGRRQTNGRSIEAGGGVPNSNNATATTRPTSAVIKSLYGGGGSGMLIEATTTTTTNGSSIGGGVMSRVCTEVSEDEMGCCLKASVISCTTGPPSLCIGGSSFGRADETAEAMAFLKYKIGHMSPTLMLVCFNFAEMCWSRLRNMDILGAVDLMPHPSQGASVSENKSTNSKPSTRLSLSKAAALLIAFLARYRLHEDDIVAVLCTAYSYLQGMDTPTLQPLVRQMVLWFYPSNILYFLAFLAHIHVLDDTS